MEKRNSIIILCIIIAIFITSIYKIFKANKMVMEYKKKYNKIREFNNGKYNLLGQKFSFSNFKNIENDKKFEDRRYNKKYFLIMIIPKTYCGKCIQYFISYLKKHKNNNIDNIVIGYNKKNMKMKKNHYFNNYPIYYIDNYSWFDKYNFENGLILLLLDKNSKKILNVYQSNEFIKKSKQRFMNFITRLNDEKN